MKVTYLGHSGFLLEFEKAYFLFDYFNGTLPLLNLDKELFIFVSHAHQDHYNRDIWELRSHPQITYIVSKDVPLSASQKQRLGIMELDNERINRVKADESHKISEKMVVETLLSTDEGVAFIVRYGEQAIFHAGDLNLWTWPGDKEEANQDRLKRFMIEMEKIRGQVFDIAFFPLDPRQEEDCGSGLRIFNQITKVKKLFPMHMWGNFEVIQKFFEKYPGESSNIIKIGYEGQIFDI